MHWPGASVLFIISQIGLIGSCILAFNENSVQDVSLKTNLLITILLVVIMVVAGLFYFSWITLFIFQAISLIISGILYIIILQSNESDKISLTYWLTVMIFLISLTFILSTKINILTEHNIQIDNIENNIIQ